MLHVCTYFAYILCMYGSVLSGVFPVVLSVPRLRGWPTRLAIVQYQAELNCIPDIPIMSPHISSLCSKAKCVYLRPWQGLVLHPV